MPDWKKIVREQMSSEGSSCDLKEEIIAELAAHLEDGYQNEIARGLGESEASQHVLSAVRWNRLAREIRRVNRKEESMNNRTRALWFPAVVNLFVATILLTLLEKLGVHPRMIHAHMVLNHYAKSHPGDIKYLVPVDRLVDMFNLPWLCTLPLSAALASLLAKRAKAPAALRLLAGLAPSLVWLVVFVAMSLEFELDRWQFPTGFPLEFSYFALSALARIVLPAVPLLLGTLPFLREPDLSRTQTN